MQWELPAVYPILHQRLQENYLDYRGIKDYIQILMLLKDYPLNEVTAAVEQALSYKVYSYEGVKNLLYQLQDSPQGYFLLERSCPAVWENRVDHFDLLIKA